MLPHKNLTDFKAKHNIPNINTGSASSRTADDIRDFLARSLGINTGYFSVVNFSGSESQKPSVDMVIKNTLYNLNSQESSLVKHLKAGERPFVVTDIDLGRVYSIYISRFLVNLLIPKEPLSPTFFQYNLGDIFNIVASAQGLKLTPSKLTLSVADSAIMLGQDFGYFDSIILGSALELHTKQNDRDRMAALIRSPRFNANLFTGNDPLPVNSFSEFLGRDLSVLQTFIRNSITNQTNTLSYHVPTEQDTKTHLLRIVGGSIVTAYTKLLDIKNRETLLANKWAQYYPEAEHSSEFTYATVKERFIRTFKNVEDYEVFMVSSLPSTIQERVSAFKATLPLVKVFVPKVEAPIVVEEPSLAKVFPAIKKASKSRKKKVESEIEYSEAAVSEAATDTSFALAP